jgi:hypothetical protein
MIFVPIVAAAISAMLGFMQGYQAERAIQSLNRTWPAIDQQFFAN